MVIVRRVLLLVLCCFCNVICGNIFSWFYETYERGIKQIEAEGRLPKQDSNIVRELQINSELRPLASKINDGGKTKDVGTLPPGSAPADVVTSSLGSPCSAPDTLERHTPTMHSSGAGTDQTLGYNELGFTSSDSPSKSKYASSESVFKPTHTGGVHRADVLEKTTQEDGAVMPELLHVETIVEHDNASEPLNDIRSSLQEGKISNHTSKSDHSALDQRNGLKDSTSQAGSYILNENNKSPSEGNETHHKTQILKIDDPGDEALLVVEARNMEAPVTDGELLYDESTSGEENGSPIEGNEEVKDENDDDSYLHVPFEDFSSNVDLPAGSSLLPNDVDEPIPEESEEADLQECNGHDCPAPTISFELAAADQKFLADASSLLSASLSPLDTCQHQLVLSLKQRCQSLSEEELGKFAVNLLNCQLHAEGRPVYSCLQHMPLSQCTRPMDAPTWNAYLLMSNRALAVCHSLRQRLFSAQARLSVDRLVQASHLNTDLMLRLQTQQEALQGVTEDTLGALLSGQQRLQQEQQDLGSSLLQTALMVNQHRVQLKAQHSSVASFTASVMRKLASAQSQLSIQASARQSAHDAVLHSLHALHRRAASLHRASERSLQRLVQTQEQSVLRQQRLQVALLQLGASVQSLHNALHNSSAQLHTHLAWLSAVVSHTGAGVEEVAAGLVHLEVLCGALVAAPLLRVRWEVRSGAVVLVLCNAYGAVVHHTALSCGAVVAAVVLLYVGSLVPLRAAVPALRLKSRTCVQGPPSTPPRPRPPLVSSGDYSSDDDDHGTSAPPPFRRVTKFASRTPASARRYPGYSITKNSPQRSSLIGGDFSSQHLIGEEEARQPLIGGEEARQRLIGGSHESWQQFIGRDNQSIFGENNLNSLPEGKEERGSLIDQEPSDESLLNAGKDVTLPSKLDQVQQLLAPPTGSRRATPTRSTPSRSTPTRRTSARNTPTRSAPKLDETSRRERSGTPTARLGRSGRGTSCSAVCKSGLVCRNTCVADTSFCRTHS